VRRALSTWAPLAAFALFLLFPFYWMVLTSIKPNEELVSVTANPFWVAHPTLDHVKYLLSQTSYPRWFWNTMAVASAATALSVSASFFAAFALARVRFPGADFCTWLLVGYLKSIPYELEEAAMVDGASRVRILFQVILPLSVPGLISAFIFCFTLSWNEYLYALVFMSSPLNKTVPVGLATELVRGDIYQWGPLMAGALLGSLPVVVVYFFFVEHYVAGMSGALKG
jgi:multiple sugar transport system permease protein